MVYESFDETTKRFWDNSQLKKNVLSLQTSHTNGVVKVLDVSDIKELSTSAIPAGIECGGGDSPGSGEHVTSIEVRPAVSRHESRNKP